jgi:hypothetical protein
MHNRCFCIRWYGAYNRGSLVCMETFCQTNRKNRTRIRSSLLVALFRMPMSRRNATLRHAAGILFFQRHSETLATTIAYAGRQTRKHRCRWMRNQWIFSSDAPAARCTKQKSCVCRRLRETAPGMPAACLALCQARKKTGPAVHQGTEGILYCQVTGISRGKTLLLEQVHRDS